jgi:hypothetical protein
MQRKHWRKYNKSIPLIRKSAPLLYDPVEVRILNPIIKRIPKQK